MSQRIRAVAVVMAMAAGALALATPATAEAAPAAAQVQVSSSTRIVDFNASPGRVRKGDAIVVTGRLELEGKEGWGGYSDQSVTITFKEKGTDAFKEVLKFKTVSKGSFKAQVKGEATGWWRAEFAATADAKASVSDSDRVDVKVAPKFTKIVGFHGSPDPVVKGEKLTFRGKLLINDRRDWDGLRGERVGILFKAKGSHKWQLVATDRTGRDGRIRESVKAEASGWFKAVFAGHDGVRGTGSRTDFVKVEEPETKADTRIVRFDAFREPVKRGSLLFFKGKLQVAAEDGWDGYKAPVKLFFKPIGSDKYVYVKTAWTSDSGRFLAKNKVWRSGFWKAVYAGDDKTNGSEAERDYVHVKRR